MSRIIPTVGRIVLYYPAPADPDFSAFDASNAPRAAMVTYVWGDTCVNLCVFTHAGKPVPKTSVRLEPDAAPEDMMGTGACGWMPFQKNQAAKMEAEGQKQ